MKIMVAGGGSGGHVNPAIAMANSLKKKYPDAEFLFIGSKKGLENDLVPKAGYKLICIPIKGFSRKRGLSKIGPYMVLIAGMIKSFFIVLRFRPDIAFGTGGFAAGPVLYWTSLFNIPTLIHEANVLPGVTNRLLSRKADITAISFPESRKYFKKAKRVELTGNPIGEKMLCTDRVESRQSLCLNKNEKLVVIMGGSQGAKPINDAVIEMLNDLYKESDFHLVFAPGKRHYEEVKKNVISDFRNVEITSYIYNTHEVYNAADLIINRAGAMTLSEITAVGIPSILIPSPYVAENHQEKNARALEIKGGCEVLNDEELTGSVLYEKIISIINDREKWEKMKQASAAVGLRDASDKISVLFDELLKEKNEN